MCPDSNKCYAYSAGHESTDFIKKQVACRLACTINELNAMLCKKTAAAERTLVLDSLSTYKPTNIFTHKPSRLSKKDLVYHISPQAMCVGFTNGYSDFASDRIEEAIVAAVPGSAVSFNRIGFFHFAVFLGWAWPKGGDSEPIPLLCHLSGDASTKPMASVRLDDFRDIVQSCTIRVYNCKCSASKRSQVILNCLYLVGKAGYNPLTNNCEHFVREVICGQSTSYQAVWTLAAPLVQLPRILLGSAVVGAATSSASSNCASKFEENRSLGLLNPERDLIEIILSKHGLHLQGVKLNSVCTREFGGLSTFPMQFLYTCRSCSGSEKMAVCRPYQKLCHAKCIFRTGIVSENVCRCSHAMKAEAVQLPLQLEESTSSVEGDGSLSSSC